MPQDRADIHCPQTRPQRFDSLIFDLFGVVVAFDEAQVYARLARHCTDSVAAELAMQGLVSTPALIRGHLTLDGLHAQLQAAHGLSLNRAAFEAEWLAPYSAPMPGMAALIETLSRRYRLVLLSNVDACYWQTIVRQHPELSAFGQRLLSFETGHAKPEAVAFQRAIAAASAPVERCYFVDDKAENIDAAQQLGLRGHRFRSTERLHEALTAEGIL